MNLELSEEQTLLADTFEKLFAAESTPERVRAAEPLGFDSALWRLLVEMRLPFLRVPEAKEGSEGSLFDAVLAAEAAGRHLASVPLIETVAANQLLAVQDSKPSVDWLLRAEGGAIITLALHETQPGTPQIVPAGAIADAVLFLSGDRLCLKAQEKTPSAPKNLGSLPLAALDLRADDAIVIAEGAQARNSYLAAREEWRLLTAASLAALGRKALEDAAAYSRERIAFDRPIGSYQGLAHPLADAATDIEAARYLVWWAVWSIAQKTTDAAALPPAVYWWAGKSAGVATLRAMRVFGGYGVSMEHAAQLYYRRARSLALIAGPPRGALEATAERLRNPRAAVPLPSPGEIGIDFGFGAAAEGYAAQARKFFSENLTPEIRTQAKKAGDGFEDGFHKKLARAGFMYPDWPAHVGGQARSVYESSLLNTVYGEQDWYMIVAYVTNMVAQMILAFGTEEAKREILPKVLSGDVRFALGYSEPSGGSDIFAAKTRAVRDGEDWVINGQKVFTSQGHLAQYALMVTRTNPNVAKHAGITLFVLPLDQPGFACHETKTLGGERTNTTFYTDMRVPDKYRLGAVDGGAKVLAAVLAMEQSGGEFYSATLRRLHKRASSWAQRFMPQSHEVQLALAELMIHIAIVEALGRRVTFSVATNTAKKHYGPMVKLFGSEAIGTCANRLMDAVGPFSLLEEIEDLSVLVEEARSAVAGTIYAGTSEIQRSLIAESALGLPRTRS